MYEMWKRKQINEDARNMYRTKILVRKFGNGQDDILGGHDLDRQGEVLIWRRKCPGYERRRMGPKLMNCCRPEPMGT